MSTSAPSCDVCSASWLPRNVTRFISLFKYTIIHPLFDSNGYSDTPTKKMDISYEFEESMTTSVIMTKTITGSHQMKIVGYSLNKGIGSNQCLTSETFTVGGYDWAIHFYPDGYYGSTREFLIFFLVLKSKNGKPTTRVNFTILDHRGRPSPFIFDQNCFVVNRKTFEESNCLTNDSFTIMCTITLVKPPCVELTKHEPVKVPPSNLDVQFAHLFETGKGADVIFEVSNEKFKAHKCVLAARSPVFDAQFFGPLSEKTEKNVRLDDIKPAVFRVLLHFIYTDSVPYLNEEDPVPMYQHLLVAADQYAIQRLKSLCENELSKRLEITNFATTLTLAEQHNCYALKASCFRFISHLEILNDVIETDGYEHLTRSCPYILTELVQHLSSKR